MFIIGLYSSYHSYFSPPTRRRRSITRWPSSRRRRSRSSTSAARSWRAKTASPKKQIDRVREDPDVVGVVLRINSPGGTVTGSDYIYHHLRELVEEAKVAARRQHGQHLRQRRLLRRDGRRRPAERDLCRADDLDRLDRRDHSALRSLGRTREARHRGRLDRQRPAQADGLAHQADDRGRAKDAARRSSTTVSRISRRSSSAAGRSSRTIRPRWMPSRPARSSPPSRRSSTGWSTRSASSKTRSPARRAGRREHRRRPLREIRAAAVALRRAARRRIAVASRAAASTCRALIDLATPRAYYLWSWLPAVLSNSK